MKKIILLICSLIMMQSAMAGFFGSSKKPKDYLSWDKTKKAFDLQYSFLGQEAYFTQTNQSALNKTQPPPKIDYSLERENLINRLKSWNNPNKISYIYLMSRAGNIMGYFSIKGKVSSVNSKLTTTTQMAYVYHGSPVEAESPDMDGSYGSNGDAIFFYLTDGTYMEWSGMYLLSDRPVKLSVQPIMTMDMTDTLKKDK